MQVVTAEQKDFPLVIDLVGSTLGNQDVPIRARVDGFLETINFIEGQDVEEGQLTVSEGHTDFIKPMTPATCGAAMLVPCWKVSLCSILLPSSVPTRLSTPSPNPSPVRSAARCRRSSSRYERRS